MSLSIERRSRLGSRTRQPTDLLPYVALGLDAGLVTISLLMAVDLRRNLPWFLEPADVSGSLTVAGPLMAVGWLSVLGLRGAFARDIFGAGTDEYKRAISASVLAAGGIGVGCYLANFPLSRGFFVLSFGIGIPLLVLGRFLMRRAIHRARERGLLHERVLIAGSPARVDEVAAVFRRSPWLGYEVTGAVTADQGAEETPGGVPVLGQLSDIAGAVRETNVDVLFLADGAVTTARAMRQLAWDLESHRVQLVVTPSVTDVASERVRIRPVGGLPLVHIERPRSVEATRWAKRSFDITGATLLLLVFAPVLLFTAARIRIHDGGPVLFRQTRVGRGGREFRCLKFRTMVVDAEAQLPALLDRDGADPRLFKLKEDPRVTKPGSWLRRFSVDELPQLANVLRGDMSLVGPRPPLVTEVEQYDATMRRRLRVRPGMTGLWQVSGRSNLAWDEAIRLDLYYVDNWSMIQDCLILGRTLRAVIGSRGAY